MEAAAVRAAHPAAVGPAAVRPRRLLGVRRVGQARWTAAALLIALAIWVPILVVAAGVLRGPDETWTHLVSTVLPTYIANSALLAAGAGLLALALGAGTAWLVTACAFPGRVVFECALILPLAVPAYVTAYTYAGMLDVAGPLQRAVRALFPSLSGRFLHVEVAGIESAILILALALYPYVYVAARSSFRRQSRTVLEASRVLGRSASATFRRVALPLARPALAAGAALVALEVLNDYGTVRYLGVPTFTTGIFRAWFALGERAAAVRLAGLLLLFVFAVLALERAQRGGACVSPTAETHRPMRRYELRGWRAAAAFAVCAAPLAFGFIIPASQLGYWAAATAGRVVDGAFVWLALRSFLLAGGAALLAVLLALVLAYAARLTHRGLVRGAARVSVLGYSVPGAAIALGVLIPFGALDRTLNAAAQSAFGVSPGLLLSGTLVALVYAYAVRFMAVGFLPVEAGFERECRNLDAASRCLGATPFGTLRRVGLPLLRGAILGALILVFVDVIKELPLTLILRPFNFDTLATRAFQLASDEQIAESASAALLLIGAGVLPVLALNRLLGRGDA